MAVAAILISIVVAGATPFLALLSFHHFHHTSLYPQGNRM